MKNRNFLKKKAVVTSILTVLIMCLASTAVPTIYGAKAIEIQDNVEKSYLGTSSYEKAFTLFKEQLQNGENNLIATIFNKLDPFNNKHLMDNLLEFSYSDFLQILDFLGSPDITKSMNLKMTISKIIPIFKQLQNIVTYNGESYEINPQLVNVMDRFNSEVEPKTINQQNSDFKDWYWPVYTTLTELMDERFHVDNLQAWFDAITAHMNQIVKDSIVPLIVSFALCAIPEMITSIFGWALLANVLYTVYDFANYIIQVYSKYAALIEWQTSIVIHVVNETGEGIYTDEICGSITAKSTDAIALCDGSSGKTSDLFTYYLGPTDGEDEGWYSLKARRKCEGKSKDCKAPHPPGNWTIDFDIDGYEETSITIHDIPKDGQWVCSNVTLNPE